MEVEIPFTKRCCFCIPLRRGLLFWGYIKSIISLLVMYPVVILITVGYAFGAPWELIPLYLIVVSDLAINIVLVVAGHTKNSKLFKLYFYYVFIHAASVTGLAIWLLALNYEYSAFNIDSEIIGYLAGLLGYLMLLAYINILVRSEFKKIDNTNALRFSSEFSNSDRPTCKLTLPDIIIDERTNENKNYMKLMNEAS